MKEFLETISDELRRMSGEGIESIPLDDDALYARARRALEGIGLGIARRDEDDLTARDLSGRLRVEQRLQVRAAAGNKNGDAHAA